MRQTSRHRLVHGHRTAGTGLGAGAEQQVGVGADPDHDQDQIDVPAERLGVGAGAVHTQPASSNGATAAAPVLIGTTDAGDGCTGVDLHVVPVQLGVHQRAQLGVDGREDLGQHLHLGDGDAAGGQTLGHL